MDVPKYSQTCLKRPLKGSKKIRPPKTGGLLTQVHYIEKCTVGGSERPLS